GSISLAIREGAKTGNANSMQTLSVQIYNAVGVDAEGNFFILGGLSDVVIGKDMIFDPTLTDASEKLNKKLPLIISPNPNNGSFNLFFEKTTVASQINIFDFSGKNIFNDKIPAHSEQLNIDLKNQLPSGVYFIKWVLADGQFVTKKMVVTRF